MGKHTFTVKIQNDVNVVRDYVAMFHLQYTGKEYKGRKHKTFCTKREFKGLEL